MALTLPIYTPTIALNASTTVGGAEGTPVLLHSSSAVTDFLRRGALIGLSMEITNWAGPGAETMIVRIYRANNPPGTVSDLILEVAVAFAEANDRAYVQEDLPAPFFGSIWATVEDQGGALNRTVAVKPDVLAIAGNSQ